MSWQMRVVRHRTEYTADFVKNMRKTHPDYPDHGIHYDFREVYYKEGAPKEPDAEWVEMWSAEPRAALGETPEELADDLKYFTLAMTLPPLDAADLPIQEETPHE